MTPDFDLSPEAVEHHNHETQAILEAAREHIAAAAADPDHFLNRMRSLEAVGALVRIVSVYPEYHLGSVTHSVTFAIMLAAYDRARAAEVLGG